MTYRKKRSSGGRSGFIVKSGVYRKQQAHGGSLLHKYGMAGKKIKFKKNQQSIAWGSSPFPRELVTQVTYAENIQITATTGAPNNYLFSTNGLYDSNISGTGAQARFFDTLCGGTGTNAPYYNYRVSASKITVEAIPDGGTGGGDTVNMRGYMGIGLFNTTTTGPSSLAEMKMRQDYRTRFIGYWSGGTDFGKLTRYAKMKSVFNIKDIKDDNDLVGDYTANPSKQARWCLTFIPADETTTARLRFLVKIVYYVTFFDRNDVTDS